MQNTSSCIRCGKPRIVTKTWTETINNSVVTFTETSCPDTECQKMVEKMLQSKRDKLASLQEKSERKRKEMMARI